MDWNLDTEKLTLSMTPRKLEKMQPLLGGWPVSRQTATVSWVSGLTGFLLHVSFAMGAGKFFVGQLLAAAVMSQLAAFASGLNNANRRVTLGPLFYDEPDFVLAVVCGQRACLYRRGHVSSFVYNIIIRPPKLTMFTDASKSAFGGYCLQTGHFFCRERSAEEKYRFAV